MLEKLSSKTINDSITTLLNNLYKSLSNFIPKKIECTTKLILLNLFQKKLFYLNVCG